MAKRASTGALGQDGVTIESALDDDVFNLNAPIAYGMTTTDDYRNDSSTTGIVPIGGSSGGTFEVPGDHDWFRITLTAGVPYVLTEAAVTVPNTFLALYDATGTSLAYGHTRLADSVLEFRPTASGTYYLDAGSMDSSAVGTYTVSAAVAPAVALTPGTVASPGSGSGKLETAGETDYYAVNLIADHVYEFRASPFGNGRLHLYQVATNVDGAPILSSVASDLVDDRGSGLYYSTARTGTYYLAASNPVSITGSSIQYFSGTYTVTAAQLDVFDDHAGTFGSAVDVFKAGAGSLSVDGSAAGRVDFQYDQDWYAVTLAAGSTYHLRLDSAGGTTGLGRPSLGLFDNGGNLLMEDDEGYGGHPLIAFAPVTTGTYYLAAQSSRARSKDMGDYVVSVAKTESDQVPDSMATTAILDAGSSTSGRIDTNGEHDWFRIALEAGRTYEFRLDNAGGGLGLPMPYLQLHDSSGSTVATAYSLGSGAKITYVALSSGVYFLDAGGLLVVSNPSNLSGNIYFGDYVLAASLGRLIGTPGNDSLTGGPHADTIMGLDGDDVLNGGAGADSMYGGTGNDAYAVDDAADQVFEAAGAGIDAVYAAVSYTLMAGQEIEFLGATSTAGVILTGNEFANTLIGNAGADRLYGGGGDDTLYGAGGRDVLSGGAGNDTYGVDAAGEKVIEAAGGGSDTVQAFVDFALGAGQEVEYLMAGSAAGLTLRGNELANFVVGNSGNDTLYGGAGNDHLSGEAGSDKVYGGPGDDFILVDSSADRVFEAAGGGNDSVYALASFTLGAGQEIETLLAASPAGLALTGNALANALVGNAGADTLDGGGGADRLIGGAGNDTFLFDTPLVGGPAAILDFTTGADLIALSMSPSAQSGRRALSRRPRSSPASLPTMSTTASSTTPAPAGCPTTPTATARARRPCSPR